MPYYEEIIHMTIEQLERRLRALELATKGADYVRAQDESDAAESAEKPVEKSE